MEAGPLASFIRQQKRGMDVPKALTLQTDDSVRSLRTGH